MELEQLAVEQPHCIHTKPRVCNIRSGTGKVSHHGILTLHLCCVPLSSFSSSMLPPDLPPAVCLSWCQYDFSVSLPAGRRRVASKQTGSLQQSRKCSNNTEHPRLLSAQAPLRWAERHRAGLTTGTTCLFWPCTDGQNWI